MSKIRVSFVRPFTYAEIETFRSGMAALMTISPDNPVKWHFQPSRQSMYIETPWHDSRTVYAIIADWTEHNLVNQHPVAVCTFSDYVAPMEDPSVETLGGASELGDDGYSVWLASILKSAFTK